MSVIDDILGKKSEPNQVQQEAATQVQPVQFAQSESPQIQQEAAMQVNHPQQPLPTQPVIQPAPEPTMPATQPIGSPGQEEDKTNGFIDNYNNTGNIYDALQSSFGKQQQLDPKKVQSQRNLARLADAATYLTDIFNAAKGGDVVNHNSIAANEDNKILQYRRYLDSQNRQYNMLAYQARMRDLQNAINQKMNIQNILYKMQRDKNTSEQKKAEMLQKKEIADNDLAAKIAKFDKDDEYNNARLKQTADYQNKRLAQENQKIRIEAMNAARKANGVTKDTQILTKDGVFQVPRSQSDSFYGQVYNKMYHEAQERKEDPSILNINTALGEGGDQVSKMKTIVNAFINEYPEAMEWVKNNAQMVGKNNNYSSSTESASNAAAMFNPNAYFPHQEEKPAPSYSLTAKPALFKPRNQNGIDTVNKALQANKKKKLPDNIL